MPLSPTNENRQVIRGDDYSLSLEPRRLGSPTCIRSPTMPLLFLPSESEANKHDHSWLPHPSLRVAATVVLSITLLFTANNRLRFNNYGDGVLVSGKSDHASPGGVSSGLALDFAVVGFPKTGTTFLLNILKIHPQIVMPPKEFCQIHHVHGDNQTMAWLKHASSSSQSNSGLPLKYGIKCPTMIRATDAIDILVKMSDQTRLVVGVRHPVRWFQSFYNFRVWEHYSKNRVDETVPKPSELTDGTKHWRDVSTAYARFDVYLRQLAKVS